MKTHYFGDNLNKKYYETWNECKVECGIIIYKEFATNNRSKVNCKNCLKLLN